MEATVLPSKFQLSGRRRAVLVGIEYTNTDLKLERSSQDLCAIWKLVRHKFDFLDDEILILSDAPYGVEKARTLIPTRGTIIDALKWLVVGAKEGDSLFFYYAGHSTQVDDKSGDELDRMDEALVPADFGTAGPLLDDDIHEITVRQLPRGTRLTAVVDASHSGTIMDLLYMHDPHGTGGVMIDRRTQNPAILNAQNAVASTFSLMSSSIGTVFNMGTSLLRGRATQAVNQGEQFIENDLSTVANWVLRKTSREEEDPNTGEVLLFSACKDHQEAGVGSLQRNLDTGAMTQAFITALRQCDWRYHTYGSLLHTIRENMLQNGYEQFPQLSSSHRFSLNSRFLL